MQKTLERNLEVSNCALEEIVLLEALYSRYDLASSDLPPTIRCNPCGQLDARRTFREGSTGLPRGVDPCPSFFVNVDWSRPQQRHR